LRMKNHSWNFAIASLNDGWLLFGISYFLTSYNLLPIPLFFFLRLLYLLLHLNIIPYFHFSMIHSIGHNNLINTAMFYEGTHNFMLIVSLIIFFKLFPWMTST
jgi:hypothetical protein